MDLGFVYGLLVSIGIGALIGLEREHRKEGDTILVGIRTFPLVAMSGYILAYLGQGGIEHLVLAGLVLFGALSLALIYIRQVMGFPGFTTTLAFIIAYLVGVLVAHDFVLEAVIVGVATTTILISKQRLHSFVRVLSEEEIMGALQFITIAFILYPLTLNLELTGPLEIFGQGQPLDLNMVLLIILFVSGISFASFLVVRWQGPSIGLRISGLLGGLINSEAATASLCGLAKKGERMMRTAACGIVLANATMFLRNLAVCVVSDPTLGVASLTALPLVLLCGFGILLGISRVGEEPSEPLELGSPFAIKPALVFGVIFFIISGFALLVEEQLGGGLVYIAALGGFASSAAVVASVSSLSLAGSIGPQTAAEIVLLACGISSMNKLIITKLMCPRLSRASVLRLVGITALSFLAALLLLSARTWL
ncbi:MAG: MgtC/SapB family protein [Methanomassiliicoccales archaeon]